MMTKNHSIFSDPPAEVLRVFSGMPCADRTALAKAREFIFAEAARLGTGDLSEGVKWGQPSFAPRQPKVGTPIRLGVHAGRPTVFVHCQTTLISEARDLFEDDARFIDNRGVHCDGGCEVARHVIGAALIYHKS